MAHTILDLRGETLFLDDLEIAIFASAVMDHAARHPDRFPPAAFPFFADWRETISDGAAGCLDLGLEQALPDDAALARFVELTEATRAELASHGPRMSGAFLTELVGIPEYYAFADRDTAVTLHTVDKVLGLLRGGAGTA